MLISFIPIQQMLTTYTCLKLQKVGETVELRWITRTNTIEDDVRHSKLGIEGGKRGVVNTTLCSKEFICSTRKIKFMLLTPCSMPWHLKLKRRSIWDMAGWIFIIVLQILQLYKYTYILLCLKYYKIRMAWWIKNMVFFSLYRRERKHFF